VRGSTETPERTVSAVRADVAVVLADVAVVLADVAVVLADDVTSLYGRRCEDEVLSSVFGVSVETHMCVCA